MTDAMDFTQIQDYIQDIPDEVVEAMSFSMPWGVSSTPDVDEDGFSTDTKSKSLTGDYSTFHELQRECWNKFVKNPQIN